MKKIILFCIVGLTIIGCTKQIKNDSKTTIKTESLTQKQIMKKIIDKNLPTIGILIFEGVIINEVVAPLDVFSSTNATKKALFNVILIAKENKTYNSAHGLKVNPDYTIDNVPKLKVLVVPSSYNPADQTSDKKLIDFIKEQNKTTDYIASHCAGAWLIGEAGIAENKEIVTYVTGGEYLKTDYPNLKVADDSKVSVVQDGKFISSNGNLVSYIASLDLLEKMTNKEHREFVETSILFDRIKEK
ncbi:MAG: DJ-1/PfpI family protein [Flavobacteriaceae bacterium]|nr:DJ-1/PfpI family protein [Flavobacteriaceae bacterium]